MTMTDAELAEIRARAEEPVLDGTEIAWWESNDRITDAEDRTYLAQVITRANATFIAHARTDVPKLCDEVEELRGEVARMREALEAAIPLLQTHSCWHDVFPELDCCEYGLVAEQASVALGNEPLPIYAEHMAALRDAGRGEPRP